MKPIHAIPAGLLLFVAAEPSQAAPFRPQLAVEPPAIQQVHGSHRACRYSPRWDWWHRHVGRHRRAIGCGRRYYYYHYDDEPSWYGPGITFRFGDRHRFHRGHRGHRFDRGRRFDRGHRSRGGHDGRRGRRR